MVKVPTYQRTETLRPAFRQDIEVRATPEAMGAGIGRAMQQAGQAVGQVAEAVQKIQAFDDENAAKDADNKFAEWLRNRAYGEGGYLTLEGRNAVEGRGKFEEEVEAERKKFAASLRPGAARMFDRASTARTMSITQQAIVHQANERKAWFRETSGARINGFAQDALANYSNPELIQKNIGFGMSELLQRGLLEGWGTDTASVLASDQYKKASAEYVSGIQSGVVAQMAEVDPIAADRYLKENAAAFLPGDAMKLRGQLEAPLRAAKTYAWLQGAIGAAPAPDFVAVNNGSMLEKMVPITIQSESNNNPNAVSPVGARGRMQIMPGTGRDPGFGIRPWDGTDADNVRIGREYLGKMMERYGNDPAKAWAAYNWGPGNLDNAIKKHGGNWLANAPKETRDYVAKNLAALGQGGGGSSDGVASTGAMLADLYAKADKIENAADREAAYGAIDRWWNRKQRVVNASRQQVLDDVDRRLIADPSFDPSKLPLSTQQVIGLSGMNSLKSAYESRLSEGKVKTDMVVYDQLLTQQARDPEGFAKVDLVQYRGSLSDSDYLKLRGYQRDAVGKVDEAIRTGKVFKDAYNVAEEFYGVAGIATGNSKNANSDKNKAAKAEFNAAVRTEVEQFIAREKRPPSYDEMRAIASALTIPVIGSETRRAWSPGRLFDDDQDDVWNGFAFQRGDAPKGLNKRINPSYANVPPEWRGPIKTDLQRKLGREPNNTEIANEWGRIAMELIGDN